MSQLTARKYLIRFYLPWLTIFRYDGDLTITVYPNLQIKIPNHQLVVPDFDIDSQGNMVEKNSSNKNVLLYSLQDVNKNDMPLFGGPFLSAAYFFVDYDQKQFSLWQSKPTVDTDLVRVGSSPPTCKADPSKVSTQPAAASNSPPPPFTSAKAAEPKKTNLTAAVVGGVVGSLVAVACASLALFLLRRRRRQQEQNALGLDADNKDPMYKQQEYLYSKAEMPTDRMPPQEMPLEQNPPYNLAPHEMNAKPDNRGTLHELPSFKAQYSLPPTPKRPRRTRSMVGNFDIGSI